MPHQQKESTSSRLVARLREISRGAPLPFGFVGRAQPRQTSAMILIASLSRNDSAMVEAAVAGGADAVLAHLHIGESAEKNSEKAAATQDAGSDAEVEQASTSSTVPASSDHAPSDQPQSLASDESPLAAPSIVSPTGVPGDPAAAVAAVASEPGPTDEPKDVHFGGLDEERERLAEMVRAAGDRPLGVVVGTNGELTSAELDELVKLGVDFVAVYPHRAPASLLKIEALGHIARLDPGYPGGPLRGLADLAVDAFAVSVGRPRESIGGFTVHDMASFRQLLETLQRPVMVASSWEIQSDDLPFFREQGVEALILTPLVLGESADSVREKVVEYHQAISALGPPLGRGRSQEGRRVLLPRVQGATEVPEVGEDDDDDDEDDD